eukprot:XP_022278170.1 uncharacterized protein LOC111097188 [Canis lupus familiaris]
MSEDNTEALVSVGRGAPGPRQWALHRGGCCPTSPLSRNQILNYLCPPPCSVYLGCLSTEWERCLCFSLSPKTFRDPRATGPAGEPSPRVSSPDCGTSLTLLGLGVLVANFSCPQRVPEEERVDAPDESVAGGAVARSPSADGNEYPASSEPSFILYLGLKPHRWMCRLGGKRQSHSSILDLTGSRAPGVGEGEPWAGVGGLPGRGASQMQTLLHSTRVSSYQKAPSKEPHFTSLLFDRIGLRPIRGCQATAQGFGGSGGCRIPPTPTP